MMSIKSSSGTGSSSYLTGACGTCDGRRLGRLGGGPVFVFVFLGAAVMGNGGSGLFLTCDGVGRLPYTCGGTGARGLLLLCLCRRSLAAFFRHVSCRCNMACICRSSRNGADDDDRVMGGSCGA